MKRVAAISLLLTCLGAHAEQPKARAEPKAGAEPKAQAVEPRALVRQAINELFNEGKLDAAERYFAPDFAVEERQFAIVVRKAFPDLRITLNKTVQEGHEVAIHWTASGTHSGDFLGVKATGRKATWSGTWFWTVRDGLISDGKAFNVWDRHGLLEQLTKSK